ncbi:hypothetical protein K7X08_006159 [Anisodus acutangulus]|uniref:Uncharacterized protein n=1 Tax=Anisodus acutangulus TaxID=402998 RepID=A0A9Q1R7V2_9SOLA|nr:hypothetical protein K7X08_006159 [Anisodus acutangulus]
MRFSLKTLALAPLLSPLSPRHRPKMTKFPPVLAYYRRPAWPIGAKTFYCPDLFPPWFHQHARAALQKDKSVFAESTAYIGGSAHNCFKQILFTATANESHPAALTITSNKQKNITPLFSVYEVGSTSGTSNSQCDMNSTIIQNKDCAEQVV